MEPLSLIAFSAGLGGASGKFVEKAWDSGEKWLRHFFKDHNDNAQKRAKENTIDFLNDLGNRIGILEQKTGNDSRVKFQIDNAMDDPDFSALLKDAVIVKPRRKLTPYWRGFKSIVVKINVA